MDAVDRRRRTRVLVAAAAVGAALLFAACGASDPGPDDAAPATDGDALTELDARVERVVDGDTVRVRARGFQTTVRLIGIDTPETRAPNTPVQCFGPQASAEAARLMPPGAAVTLRTDPTQDQRDRFGRLLAYVYRGGREGADSVNRALVEGGFATVFVFDVRAPFVYTAQFEASEERARTAARGLWGPPCRGDTDRPADAGPTTLAAEPAPTGVCDPGYAGACVPAPPPDLDCEDVDGPVRVLGDDPHRLDGDGDGIACS